MGVGKLDIKGFGEILSQKMRGPGLQGLPVLHQSFDAIGIYRPRKAFLLGFDSFDNGHGHPLFRKVCVHVQHLLGFVNGLLCGRMGGMTLLP